MDSLILKNPLLTNIEQFRGCDSAILKSASSLLDELKAEQLYFLIDALDKPKKMHLLFRASEHDFRVAAFHEKCDNKADTVVLVRTEFGKTIGGYSHQSWDSKSGWLTDEERRCFLFSLDLKEKYVPQSDKKLIHRHSNNGPLFGGGSHDLYISDQCNNNRSSQAAFPSTYNRAGGDKLESNQANYSMFSGATDGYTFRVLQYEVFQVYQ